MQINPAQIASVRPLRPGPADAQQQVENARDVQAAFRRFVGATFYGQMLKSMRSTVGKPAYFHGGQGEEVFRSQLDQTLADQMTTATADKIADPMFGRQFPQLAQLLKEADQNEHAGPTGLAGLENLRRR